MQLHKKESTTNVIVTAMVVATILVVASILVLWLITKNIFLDIYYTLEVFFEAPNSSGAFELAEIAPKLGTWKFIIMTTLVAVDNIGRIVIISFVIAAVIDMLSYYRIDTTINSLRIRGINGHVIICGYNSISEMLMHKLKEKKMKFVVIDDNAGNIDLLTSAGILAIEGKFTDAVILKRANIPNAKAVVFTSQSDLENIIGTMEAKKLNKNVKIISRATLEEVRAKFYMAGADMCVLPEYLTGIELGEKLAKEVKV